MAGFVEPAFVWPVEENEIRDVTQQSQAFDAAAAKPEVASTAAQQRRMNKLRGTTTAA